MTSISFSQTRGSGNVKSEDRKTGSFSAVKLSCSADLFISQGSTSVTVKTDDNILELVETKVENGTLHIDIKGRGFRSVKVLEVYITMPELTNLKNSGSGDIEIKDAFKASDLVIGLNGSGDLDANLNANNLELRVSGSGDTELTGVRGTFKVSILGSGDLDAEGLKLENCYIKNSGSGDMELSGKTNSLDASNMGSGDVNGYNLLTVDAVVTNSGSGDVTLNVVEKLNVTLNGSGDLTYRGNPTNVDVRERGSGEVYKK